MGTHIASRYETVLAILAGENITIFGMPVEFTLSWPQGLPVDFATDEQMREWAAGELRRERARRDQTGVAELVD